MVEGSVHVYDDGVGVDTGAVESVVSISLYTTAFPSPATTTFLVVDQLQPHLPTHPRHGLPYPSSRASANAPTKAKRTGQFDSQTLMFTLV